MFFSFPPLKRLFSVFLILTVLVLPLSATAAEPVSAESDLIGGSDSGIINILLIGQDAQTENEPVRADSIILCTLQPEDGCIIMTSFLRDLYVRIPGHEDNRLNAAYAFGGMELLRQTMEENFHIIIDGCIETDFSQFSQIINTLGGVMLELRQDEADAINQAIPGSLTAGSHLLTGSQALAYSRLRKLDSDGDFSRTCRQRKLLSSLLDQYRDAGFLTILSVVIDLLPMISTDLDKKEILILASKLFPLLQDPAISSQQIPMDKSYTYDTIRNMEVLTADMEKIRQYLKISLVPSQ